MNEIYAAIYSKLDTDLTQTIYDHVPENETAFPFVVLKPLENNNNDTDTELGFISTAQIEVYSRYRGSKEAATIQGLIYASLHRAAMTDTESYCFSTIQETFSTITTEGAGLTRVSVQRFTVIFEDKP